MLSTLTQQQQEGIEWNHSRLRLLQLAAQPPTHQQLYWVRCAQSSEPGPQERPASCSLAALKKSSLLLLRGVVLILSALAARLLLLLMTARMSRHRQILEEGCSTPVPSSSVGGNATRSLCRATAVSLVLGAGSTVGRQQRWHWRTLIMCGDGVHRCKSKPTNLCTGACGYNRPCAHQMCR